MRVWPGRRPVPGIVAPGPPGSTRSRMTPSDVPRHAPPEEIAMDTVFAKVAGLDVHQKFITVGVRCHLDTGTLFAEVRTFGTMTKDLRALADYLEALGVTHVALESTGVLWKPVWNILEGRFTLLLVNPRHIKQVPGRKSDVKDAEWIAQLLQCGLLRGSFVPPRELRELRDLTRFRAQLASEQTRLANRIHKVLEGAKIKLGAVASDILGKSQNGKRVKTENGLERFLDPETENGSHTARKTGQARMSHGFRLSVGHQALASLSPRLVEIP